MTTQTAPQVIDFSPLWDVLNGLGWHEIPEDLTEIDENWCYNQLVEYCAGELEELVDQADWETMKWFAYDLRDAWHTSRAEEAEYMSGKWW